MLTSSHPPCVPTRVPQWIALAATAGLLWGGAAAARAHGVYDEHLARADRRVEAEPGSADSWVARAGVHSAHGHWDRALLDLDRARSLEPSRSELSFLRGRVLLSAGRHSEADRVLSEFLQSAPGHAGAWLTRARARTALERPAEAAADYDRAIGLSPRPLPDHYVWRARAQAAAGRPGDAIRGLDEGLARLGPLPVLASEAVDLEEGLGRFDAALARLDGIASKAPRQGPWLARRAAILEKAGRKAEARRSVEQALTELATLPERRRGSRAAQQSATELRSQLVRLSAEAD